MLRYYHSTQNEKLRSMLPVFVNSYAYNYEQHPWQYKNGSFVNHINLVLSGKGIIEVNGETFNVSEGDIFFFKANLPISYGPKSEKLVTRFYTFGGYACESLFTLYEIPNFKIFNNQKFAISLSEFCKSAENGLSDEELSAKLYTLIIEFCTCIKGRSQPEKLERILEYIKKNIYKDISVNELCELADVSRGALFKLFSKNLGITPVHYINRSKIDLAKVYLESSPNLSVESIAFEVGFASTSYFIETFKKHEGITPAKFRKLQLEN